MRRSKRMEDRIACALQPWPPHNKNWTGRATDPPAPTSEHRAPELPQSCSQLEAVAGAAEYQEDTQLADLPILPDDAEPETRRIVPFVPCPDCGHDTACGQCLVPKNGGTLYCCRCGATLDAPTPNPAEADALRRSFGTRPRRQLRPAKQDRLFDPLPQLRLSFDPGAKDDEAPHRR